MSEEEHQRRVDRRFEFEAAFWRDVYRDDDVYGFVFRERHERALRLVDRLRLPSGARVLDLGAGAGLLAADLGRRGLRVDALDSVEAMVRTATETVRAAGVADTVRTAVADAHALPYEDGAVDAAVALGLLPWVRDPAGVLGELARVVRPDGGLVVSCDNSAALQAWLDPRLIRSLDGPKRALRRALGRPEPAWPRPFSRRHLQALLAGAGFTTESWQALQFGPYSFFGLRPIPSRSEVALHSSLQRRADAGRRPWTRLAMQHLVLARRV